jgi:hypothetical protein
MSTQRIHYLTVIGDTAVELEAACDALLARMLPEEEPVWKYGRGRSSDDWSEEDQQRIAALCQSLLEASTRPPVVWYSQFVDGYGMGLAYYGWGRRPWPDGKVRDLYEANWTLTYFPSAIAPAILSEIDKIRRKKEYRAARGGLPTIDHLRTALTCVFSDPPAITIVISECLGASWMDDDVHASRGKPLPLPALDGLLRRAGNA